MRFQFAAVKKIHRSDSAAAQRVLRAAKAVFVRDGGAAFSARAVARQAGVNLAAVQYFYPTTNQLLAAMLEYIVNEYESAYEALFRRLPVNGEARLFGVVDVLLNSNWRKETRRVFYGLYALACHNKFAATLLTEMTSWHVRNLAAFIGGARPALADERCFELAVHLQATINGAMLFTALAGRRPVTRAVLSSLVHDALVRLLDAPLANR